MTVLPMSYEQWCTEINRRLNAARPDRYHEDDWAWMEPVASWAAKNMPPGVRARILDAIDDGCACVLCGDEDGPLVPVPHRHDVVVHEACLERWGVEHSEP